MIGSEIPSRVWRRQNPFRPGTVSEIQKEILGRLGRALENGETPWILLDLDSTLFNLAPRNERIFREWAQSEESQAFPSARKWVIHELQDHHIGYSIHDTLLAGGFSESDPANDSLFRQVYQYWKSRFFSNEYVGHDSIYPGAAEWVNKLYLDGAKLVYLTGRDRPSMGVGTEKQLFETGLPVDATRTRLFMKPRREMDDLTYKSETTQEVNQLGLVIASFENEPVNVVMFHEKVPTALPVFVDTVCSDRPVRFNADVYRWTW